MAVQGLLEFWPCKSLNKLISGCLLWVAKEYRLLAAKECLKQVAKECLGLGGKRVFSTLISKDSLLSNAAKFRHTSLDRRKDTRPINFSSPCKVDISRLMDVCM